MRPGGITILCIILFLMGLTQLLGATFELLKSSSTGAILGMVTSLLLLVSVYGLWKMKFWAPILFFVLLIANFIFVFGFAPASMVSIRSNPWPMLAIPVIYLIIVGPHWKKFLSKDAKPE